MYKLGKNIKSTQSKKSMPKNLTSLFKQYIDQINILLLSIHNFNG